METRDILEQPLPPNGVCNLASIDLSKLIKQDKTMDYDKLKLLVQMSTKFLDSVIDKSSYPTLEIEKWAKENRAIGTGIMGWADYCLIKELTYGSKEANDELENIVQFMYQIAEDTSIEIGKLLGVPKMCKRLPIPRRNITLLTVPPTGTVSLIAGCSSGIECIFSEITVRNDKTGTYTFENDLADKPYFRCAVASNGAIEVTWEEHIQTLASAQKHIDSGVSKTVNFPNGTHRDTIGKAFLMAWKMRCKGVAMYRNGSRKVEVLSPKNLKKDKCPLCGEEILLIAGKKKCSKCEWIMIEDNNAD